MSVLLGDRKESKFEAITYSIELHDMLILLMQRGFGVKDVYSLFGRSMRMEKFRKKTLLSTEN